MGKLTAMTKRAKHTEWIVKRLLDICEGTSVTYGHGDFGDALAYEDALRNEARNIVANAGFDDTEGAAEDA